MAYLQTSRWISTPALHALIEAPLETEFDWSVDPIMLFKGVTGITAIDSIALMSTVALTDGTNPLSFTVELHTTNTLAPVTAETKLLDNVMPAPLTAVTADSYRAVDWGRHAFMPVIALAPKSASSPSLQADIMAGHNIYDVVLRSNAKAAQTLGVVYIRVLYYQYIDGNFAPGAKPSCCVVGYTPATN